MVPKPLTMNPNYLAMVRGTRELHQLLAAGKEDSPEADAIRDATDGPWQTLSETERGRVRNLSRRPLLPHRTSPPAQPMDAEAQAKLNEAFEARLRGEWEPGASTYCGVAGLHRPRPAQLPARGSIWLEAGDPVTAAVFFEHASRNRPEDATYLAMHLHALSIADPPAALRRRGNPPGTGEVLRRPSYLAPPSSTCRRPRSAQPSSH